ncbi:MAG: phosphatase PAP2 family protein [Candidatus Schekmanbacteria bacterium]|nr:phosphatase PAP2 family protein [Candidatus Schekmanbacteria bacterium]
MELLFKIDSAILFFFNISISNPVLDFLMPIITNAGALFPVVLIAGLISIYFAREQKLYYTFSFLVSMYFSQIASHQLKVFFNRPRPATSLDWVNVIGSYLYDRSFPSGHATAAFAMGIFFSMKFPRYKAFFISLAVLVAISRMYLGVHYPSDVIAGALTGSTITFLCVTAIDRLAMFRKKSADSQ